MGKIDIKSRLRNKAFITTFISTTLLCVKTVAKIEVPAEFGIIVNAVLWMGTFVGVVIDSSTPGFFDKEDNKL